MSVQPELGEEKTAPAPFTSLPTELVEQVAQFLDVESFRSFRLTCHFVNFNTKEVFRKRFFTTSTLRWQHSSFDRLSAITAEGWARKLLKHLIIDATPYYAQTVHRIRFGACEPHDDPNCSSCPLPNPQDVSKKLAQAKAQEKAFAESWSQSLPDVTTLKAIFSLPEITISTITFAYKGLPGTYSPRAQSTFTHASQIEMSRPFISTLSAMAQSGISTVTSIRLSPTHPFGTTSIGRLEALARYLPLLRTPLENLTVLELRLRDWRSPLPGFEMDDAHVPFVVRFLSQCTNLESLKLEVASTLEEPGALCAQLARTAKWSRLRRLSLSLLVIADIDDLWMLLAPARRVLEELELRNVLVRDARVTSDPQSAVMMAPGPGYAWGALRYVYGSYILESGDGEVVRSAVEGYAFVGA